MPPILVPSSARNYLFHPHSARNYLFKVSSLSTRIRCESCSILKMSMLMIFNINGDNGVENSKDVKWVSLLLTSNIALVNSIEFEQVNAGWAELLKKGVFKNSCFVKLSLWSEILEKYLWRSSFLVKF